MSIPTRRCWHRHSWLESASLHFVAGQPSRRLICDWLMLARVSWACRPSQLLRKRCWACLKRYGRCAQMLQAKKVCAGTGTRSATSYRWPISHEPQSSPLQGGLPWTGLHRYTRLTGCKSLHHWTFPTRKPKNFRRACQFSNQGLRRQSRDHSSSFIWIVALQPRSETPLAHKTWICGRLEPSLEPHPLRLANRSAGLS